MMERQRRQEEAEQRPLVSRSGRVLRRPQQLMAEAEAAGGGGGGSGSRRQGSHVGTRRSSRSERASRRRSARGESGEEEEVGAACGGTWRVGEMW